MDHIFVNTLMMMCISFAIAMVVAGVIKLIANQADSIEFNQRHQAGLIRLKRIQRVKRRLGELTYHQKDQLLRNHEKLVLEEMEESDLYDYYHGNPEPNQYVEEGLFGSSCGHPEEDMVERFYPHKKTKKKVAKK